MKYFISLLLIVGLLVVGCATQSIADIKNENYIGKEVKVQGIVQGSIKIGTISAYSIKDESGESIGVSSPRLPADGDEVTVKGIVMKDTLFGYYIKPLE